MAKAQRLQARRLRTARRRALGSCLWCVSRHAGRGAQGAQLPPARSRAGRDWVSRLLEQALVARALRFAQDSALLRSQTALLPSDPGPWVVWPSCASCTHRNSGNAGGPETLRAPVFIGPRTHEGPINQSSIYRKTRPLGTLAGAYSKTALTLVSCWERRMLKEWQFMRPLRHWSLRGCGRVLIWSY